jgi:DNA-binding NarL/FixJ family response regulator
VARVLALIPDLLFGSNVQGALRAAGHEVQLTGDPDAARADAPRCAVLVVDLTHDEPDGAALVSAMRAAAELPTTRTLGFYSHVDVAARERAEQAGFDLVVPRSRMAREGAELVTRLADAPDADG